jgi:hypothetical protein
VEHIDKLAQYFQLPHALFFEALENQNPVYKAKNDEDTISLPQTQPNDLSRRMSVDIDAPPTPIVSP